MPIGLSHSLSLSLTVGALSTGALTVCRYHTTPGIAVLCTRGDRAFVDAFAETDACRAALGYFVGCLALAVQLLIFVRTAQSCVWFLAGVVSFCGPLCRRYTKSPEEKEINKYEYIYVEIFIEKKKLPQRHKKRERKR